MTIRDWIGSPPDWGGWGTRANAWLNELADQANTNIAGIATNLADIATNTAKLDDIDTGAWSGWTPTVTGLGTVTIPVAGYTQIGKTVHCFAQIQAGTPSGVSVTSTLPVAPNTNWYDTWALGNVWAYDASGNLHYNGAIAMQTSDSGKLSFWQVDAAGGSGSGKWGGTNGFPFTWAATDRLHYSLTYEAA